MYKFDMTHGYHHIDIFRSIKRIEVSLGFMKESCGILFLQLQCYLLVCLLCLIASQKLLEL